MIKSPIKFQVDSGFESRAFGALRSLPTVVAGLPSRFSGAFGHTVIGGFAGWGAAVLAGALLMTQAARETYPGAHSAPVAAVEAPQAAAVAATPKVESAALAAAAAPSPAPAPAPKVVAKTTARVDMTPTGAIAQEPAAKPKHKPHKKKAKALDNPQ
ncbi:MAG: hypothetical protein KGM15_12365 [Pseudomonadota bacterium]|nr:hypothetical protein [Pseudomonadota bacterium]